MGRAETIDRLGKRLVRLVGVGSVVAVAAIAIVTLAYAQQAGPYNQTIKDTNVAIEMVAIPGGTFVMGSPVSERNRSDDEGPQREVTVDPFWMSAHEITWDAYEVWMFGLDKRRRRLQQGEATERDELADGVTGPTMPFTDMTFGMGKEGHPAICMTQLAARTFCRWLSAKTGRYYRLPTEAEWEYASRAGATTAYHFGDASDELGEYAWYAANSGDKYHKVGTKRPNGWGLYDMHGNVAEWVLDQYVAGSYSMSVGKALENPLTIPAKLYPRVVRGGSWVDPAERLRGAARGKSDPSWKQQDPQIPKSIWYHTDALQVGFRIVRPLREPSDEEKKQKWEKSEPIQ